MTWIPETSRIRGDSRNWQPHCGPSHGLSFCPTQLLLLLPHCLHPRIFILHETQYGYQDYLLFKMAFYLLLPLLIASILGIPSFISQKEDLFFHVRPFMDHGHLWIIYPWMSWPPFILSAKCRRTLSIWQTSNHYWVPAYCWLGIEDEAMNKNQAPCSYGVYILVGKIDDKWLTVFCQVGVGA